MIAAVQELEIRQWRMALGQPYGMLIWFDQTKELVRLYEREPRENPGVVAFCEGDDTKHGDQMNIFDQRENPHGLPF